MIKVDNKEKKKKIMTEIVSSASLPVNLLMVTNYDTAL